MNVGPAGCEYHPRQGTCDQAYLGSNPIRLHFYCYINKLFSTNQLRAIIEFVNLLYVSTKYL